MANWFRQIARLLGWLLVVSFLGTAPLAVAEAPAKDSGKPVRAPLAILFSSDTEGYLEPCG